MKATDKLQFGKHKGSTLLAVAKADPSYILWAAKKLDKISIPQEVVDLAEEHERLSEDMDSPLADMGRDAANGW